MKRYIPIFCLMITSAYAAEPQYLDLSQYPFVKQTELKARIDDLNLHPTLPKLKDTSLQTVNNFVNSFKYSHNDMNVHWKSPAEFFHDKGGDCKDYAVVKYYYLRDKHDVKIAIGRLKKKGQEGHAVLVVDDTYVLDNRFNKIETLSEAEKGMKIYGYIDQKGMYEQESQ